MPDLYEITEQDYLVEILSQLKKMESELSKPVPVPIIEPVTIPAPQVHVEAPHLEIPPQEPVDFTVLMNFWRGQNEKIIEALGSLGEQFQLLMRNMGTRSGRGAGISGGVAQFPTGFGTSIVTTVPDTNVPVTLLEANASRRILRIHNDSTTTCYIKYGDAPSDQSFTVRLPSQGSLHEEFPCYTGKVTAVWTADGTGDAHITEVVS